MSSLTWLGDRLPMSLPRLTLLPMAERKHAPQRLHLQARAKAIPRPVQTAEVTSISRISQGVRWRTEAMRSYDRPVLIWFTRGQGRITISGCSGGYGAHSAVFLPAGTMHGFTVTPAVLGSVVRLSARDWPVEPVHLRLREVHLHRELTGMIDAIEREQTIDADGKTRAIAHHEGLLSIWFDRTQAATPITEQANVKSSTALRLTEAFTSLVERDFCHPLGVQHYAAQLGVTPTHLTRVCRIASGRAALDILSDRRHFEACRLLKDTDLAVSRIASQSGFASPAYFTRAFRSKSGLSPTEFRHAR